MEPDLEVKLVVWKVVGAWVDEDNVKAEVVKELEDALVGVTLVPLVDVVGGTVDPPPLPERLADAERQTKSVQP